ncbi:MAG TPA: hypothetical protein VK233_07760 [Candidatus Dormibacteraeota bacterium]|nr:hypothetical protein [Candidatus Dormibacteraeota bacterium]
MAKHDKEHKKKTAGDAAADHKGSAAHHAAKAHGRAATVDASLPATREELMTRHAEARKRRNSAPLDSEAFRAAVDELGRIEVRVAAIERDLVPPKG